MPDIRTTDTLSTFPPPAEDPLSEGGIWSRLHTTWVGMEKTSGHSIVNQETGTLGWTYYNPASFDGDNKVEVWGLATGGGGGVGGYGWRLGLFKNPGVGGSPHGYAMVRFTALDAVVLLRRYASPTSFVNIAQVGFGPEQGYYMLRLDGNEVQVWYSGDSITWGLVTSATDNTHRDDMYLAYGAEDQGFGQICGWTEVGGGIDDLAPQIYRRPNE